MANTNKKRTVLFVEDEQEVLKQYSAQLNKAGYEVLEAHDGEQGLKLALEKHPDLILLDILLPKVNGIELLRNLRKNLWGRKAQVIIITNFNYQDWISESIKLGVYQYLVKSQWSIDDVVLKVGMQLGK